MRINLSAAASVETATSSCGHSIEAAVVVSEWWLLREVAAAEWMVAGTGCVSRYVNGGRGRVAQLPIKDEVACMERKARRVTTRRRGVLMHVAGSAVTGRAVIASPI